MGSSSITNYYIAAAIPGYGQSSIHYTAASIPGYGQSYTTGDNIVTVLDKNDG